MSLSFVVPWRVTLGVSFALLGTMGALGCGGSGAKSPERPLPSYTGHATELFDDAIEPNAVGLDLETDAAPRGDARLRERAQVGDAVMRVRVSTVTAKEEDSGAIYQVGFESLDKLAGAYPPDSDFAVRVDRESPAIGIVKSFEGRLIGKTFIVFLRMFVRSDGDRELHFHIAPDSKDEAAAVQQAVTLEEVDH